MIKLTSNKTELKKAIGVMMGAVSTQKQNPILESILFDCTNDNKIILSATDLSLSIQTSIHDCKIEKSGKVAIPAKMLFEVISKFPNADICIEEVENNKISLSCSKSKFMLQKIDSDNFPTLPILSKEKSETNIIKMPQNILKQLINNTIFSVAMSDDKPILKGLCIEIKNSSIYLVGIDGYRIAIGNNSNIITDETNAIKCVIPEKSMRELSKMLSDSEENIIINIGNNMAMFEINENIIYTGLLEGEYINYNNLISPSFATNIQINRCELIDSLERAYIIARQDNHNVIKFDVNESEIIISSQVEIGQSNEILEIENNGVPVSIGFNVKYILDILKVIDDDVIYIKMNTPTSSTIITGIFNTDFTYLVLPVTLNK